MPVQYQQKVTYEDIKMKKLTECSIDEILTKVLDIASYLPRVEILERYIDEEIDDLQKYLNAKYSEDNHTNDVLHRLRELVWMSEEISTKCFDELNKIQECNILQ